MLIITTDLISVKVEEVNYSYILVSKTELKRNAQALRHNIWQCDVLILSSVSLPRRCN